MKRLLSYFVAALIAPSTLFASNPISNLTAKELAPEMGIGINIGNTLESIGGETAWGAALINRDYIRGLKDAGYRSVRIPCSWNLYMDEAGTIDARWLDRVHEVVGYAVDEDMFVVLNDHWDNGWLENDIPNGYNKALAERLTTMWTQIAEKMEHFDQHLLFAGLNEPNCDNATHATTLKRYEQDFIKAVRATGGNNADRILVIQCPGTDIEKTVSYKFTLPGDTSADRLMAEVHFYSPYNFCLMEEDASWGKTFWFWGKGNHVSGSAHNPTWGEEAWVDARFAEMKQMFADKGIPVVLGEYACMERSELEGTNDWEMHQKSRAYWTEYITHHSLLSGMIPFYWDIPYKGIFDRNDGTLLRPEMVQAMMSGYRAASVDEILSDDSTDSSAEYFDLSGRRVSDPAEGGFYILRRGSRAAKVIR